MQRRAFKRVPANIKVKFFCCESQYDGTLMNVSEGGMYISTDEMRFPFDSEIDIIIPINSDILKIPV
jgi:c-di-GMP-binding flagellar brake protein YcgR